jgi:hypothetical protein
MKRILISLGLILTACDPTPPPQPETERQPSPVFDTQIEALERARKAEEQMTNASEAQREQIDEATRP